jgi:hypothetical protein
MPPAKKPTPSSPRKRAGFKEPAALKRLNRSLDAAQEALGELRKDTGRDVGEGARDLYKDLRTFVTSARRDSGKLAKALQRDFEQAQKRLAGAPAGKPAPARAARPRTSSTGPATGRRRASTAAKATTTRKRTASR